MPDARPKPPVRIKVKVCECGSAWFGGNAKYCPSGHAYRFTEIAYIREDKAQ